MQTAPAATAQAMPVSEPRHLRREDMQNLARLPLFCGLCREGLERVTAEASVVRYPQGAVVLHQGAVPQYLHVLLEGQIGLLGTLSDGEETMVEILRDGEDFIAAAVLTERPYLMGAVALKDSRVLLLPAEQLRRDLKADPDLAVAMLTSVSTHFRMLVREVKDLKLKSAAQRLGLYLLGLTPKRVGSVIVRLPHSKGVIAARIGIRAETLSRAFASLKGEGTAVTGHTVMIDDLAHLARFCMAGEETI